MWIWVSNGFGLLSVSLFTRECVRTTLGVKGIWRAFIGLQTTNNRGSVLDTEHSSWFVRQTVLPLLSPYDKRDHFLSFDVGYVRATSSQYPFSRVVYSRACVVALVLFNSVGEIPHKNAAENAAVSAMLLTAARGEQRPAMHSVLIIIRQIVLVFWPTAQRKWPAFVFAGHWGPFDFSSARSRNSSRSFRDEIMNRRPFAVVISKKASRSRDRFYRLDKLQSSRNLGLFSDSTIVELA